MVLMLLPYFLRCLTNFDDHADVADNITRSSTLDNGIEPKRHEVSLDSRHRLYIRGNAWVFESITQKISAQAAFIQWHALRQEAAEPAETDLVGDDGRPVYSARHISALASAIIGLVEHLDYMDGLFGDQLLHSRPVSDETLVKHADSLGTLVDWQSKSARRRIKSSAGQNEVGYLSQILEYVQETQACIVNAGGRLDQA
jgi:hypothetical protein